MHYLNMALIDKASLLFVPSVVAQEKAFNILPSGNRAPDSTDQNSGYDNTRADFSFDRGSNAAATRVNADGLIEKYRENLLLNSNVFNSGVWSNDDTTETSGFEGYDGTNNAWKLVGNTNASRHHIVQSISQGGVNAWSLYAKASGHSYVQFGSGSTTNQYVNFDLSDGSIGNIGSDFFSAIAEDIGSGWYRLSVVDKGSTNGFYISLVSSKTAGWLESWTMPNATDGILFQSAQLESGMVSTDYLDSTSVTAKAGVLIDLPRINFDANGENGSLLLEPSRANLVQFSEYFGGWNKSTGAITITQNYGISPEGVKNSSRIQFTSSSQHINISTSLGVGVVSTGSVYIKGTNGETIEFDTGGAGSLKTLNGDWQRIEVTSTSVSSLFLINTFNGATARDIEVWGAQCEQASYPSSYIPNHGTSGGVTRAADSCNGGGSAESINSVEGVLYWECSALNDDAGTTRVLSISNGTNSNTLYSGYISTTNVIQSQLVVGGVAQTNMRHTISDRTEFIKVAVLYKNNDHKMYINGEEVETDTSGSVPAANTFDTFNFDLGQGSFDFYGNVKQVAVFNEALSDSELATLTTL